MSQASSPLPPTPASRAAENSLRGQPQLLPLPQYPQTLGSFPTPTGHPQVSTHDPPLCHITEPRQKAPARRDLKAELLNSLNSAAKFWGNAYMISCFLLRENPCFNQYRTHLFQHIYTLLFPAPHRLQTLKLSVREPFHSTLPPHGAWSLRRRHLHFTGEETEAPDGMTCPRSQLWNKGMKIGI